MKKNYPIPTMQELALAHNEAQEAEARETILRNLLLEVQYHLEFLEVCFGRRYYIYVQIPGHLQISVRINYRLQEIDEVYVTYDAPIRGCYISKDVVRDAIKKILTK